MSDTKSKSVRRVKDLEVVAEISWLKTGSGWGGTPDFYYLPIV